MKSLFEEPVSLANAIVGAAADVSSVNVSGSEGSLMLPATSVCRTSTVLLPAVAGKLADQAAPSSVEYSTSAPGSTPDSARAASLVMKSLEDWPESSVRSAPGADGDVMSRANDSGDDITLILPAASI